MTRARAAAAACCAALLCATLVQAREGRSERVRVTKVRDGDTVEVDLGRAGPTAVRLIGIDAPERERGQAPAEYLAEEAALLVRRLIADAPVRLVREEGRADRDDYGRLLRYVLLADGRLLNAELVRLGHARVLARYPFARQKQLEQLEQQARRDERGLWAEGGLAELAWNAEHGRAPLRLHPMTDRSWAVQYGDWVKPHVRPEALARELAGLRRLIGEASGDDLDARLAADGYHPWPAAR